ncbi:C40 family peptidase [Mucilaginibacter defluvii]|uniref:C40 family peptidase n=2 Tax=Mucilaginibacter defluvii TaxID=1196019 RepID=A0ABP9FQU3_9SPHI
MFTFDANIYMEYGICNMALAPLKAEASERSEIMTQVLFGEAFEILEWQEHWVKITTAYDNYTGWIGKLLFTNLDEADYNHIKQTPPAITNSAVTWAFKKPEMALLYLPFGSSLPFLEGDECRVGDDYYAVPEVDEELEDTLIETAMQFLNAPYLWGGRTHFGIDCSGLTQAVFKLHGIKIDRDASQQALQGELVTRIEDAKEGDLAFFANAEGRITHVGILLGDGNIIHASGRVKIEQIDEKGIYSEEQGKYTHQLALIKRYFNRQS